MGQNILLIVIDTARADVFQELLEAGELPNLADQIDGGRHFTDAISVAPWTLPSHASMFTGQLPSDHGCHAANKEFNPDVPTVAEQLRDHGYTTMGISGNIWVSPEFGFGRGFRNLSMKDERFWSGQNLSGVSRADTFGEKITELLDTVDAKTVVPTVANGIYSKLSSGRGDKGARNTTRRTRKWLRNNGRAEQPFFYFINYLEPHLDYEPPEEYATPFLPERVSYEAARDIDQEPWRYVVGERTYEEWEFEALRALDKGELKYTDERIGSVVDELQSQGEETTVIVVGDHGENIGDHGLMDHQYCLYQSLVHVPLLINGPDVDQGVSSDVVETRDIYPTILDIAGVDTPTRDSVSSHSLLGETDRTVALSEYIAPQPEPESLYEEFGAGIQPPIDIDRSFRSAQDGRWKLIEDSNGDVELYDLDADPDEQRDVSADNDERVAALREAMDRGGATVEDTSGGEIQASEASKQRLAELGYI